MIKVTAPAKDVRLVIGSNTTIVKAKQTRYLPDHFRQPAHEAACDVEDNASPAPAFDATRVPEVVDALRVIMDSGDTSLLTTNGEPRATAFTDLLDFKPTADERQAAWDQFNGA